MIPQSKICDLSQKLFASETGRDKTGRFFSFLERGPMGELHDWLREQPPGLKTYRVFREMLAQAAAADPGHRAVYRLLADLTSGFEDFDEEPMPPDLADRAFARLLQI